MDIMKKNTFTTIAKLIAFTSCLFISCLTFAQGSALNFSRPNGNYILCGTVAGIYPAGSSFTKEAWILRGPSITAENIISSVDPFWLEPTEISPGVTEMRVNASNNFQPFPNHNYDVFDNRALEVGRWTHFAVTYDAPSTTMKLYRNGVLISTNTAVPFAPASGQNYVGAYVENGNPPAFFLNGSLDELRVYNVALTQAQVQANMVSPTPVLPGNLRVHYNFNEGVPGGNNTGIATVIDASGNGTSSTMVNFVKNGTESNWVGSMAMVVPVATTASGITQTTLTANWNTPVTGSGNVSFYVLQVSTTADFSSIISTQFLGFGTNSFGLTGLTANTTYYYRVSTNGDGAYSNVVSASTLSTLPVDLTDFNAVKAASGSNLLQWSTSTEINSREFEIQRSEDGRNFVTIAKQAASGNSTGSNAYQYTDNAIAAAATIYYYRLKINDNNGSFKYSNVIFVREGKTGAITVYPNPVKDRFVINTNNKKLFKTTATLTDANGKLMQQIIISQTATQVDLTNYARGIYLLRLADGSVTKIIKQ
jgi:hypothetical protein